MRICSFLGILTPPPHMGAQKNFFCVDFPKTKPKTISNLPKRLFQVFRLSTREWPFSNWIWPCLKKLKIFGTRFEIWCPKIAIRVLSAHVFAFEEILGRFVAKKIWHRLRPSESAKSGQFPTNGLNLDGFWRFVSEFLKILAVRNLIIKCDFLCFYLSNLTQNLVLSNQTV